MTAVAGALPTRRSYVEASTVRWSSPSPVVALAWGSTSTTRMRCPRRASAAPTFTVVVVLATPPFWLATQTRRPRPRPVPLASKSFQSFPTTIGSRFSLLRRSLHHSHARCDFPGFRRDLRAAPDPHEDPAPGHD